MNFLSLMISLITLLSLFYCKNITSNTYTIQVRINWLFMLLVRLLVNRSLFIVKVLRVKSYMWVFHCQRVGTLNLCVIQGSSVFVFLCLTYFTKHNTFQVHSCCIQFFWQVMSLHGFVVVVILLALWLFTVR